MNKKDFDFIGQTFNHLTVVKKGPSYISPKGHKSSQWYCKCDCGNTNLILVKRCNLTSGNTKSCGCQNDKMRKNNLKKAINITKLDLTNKTFGKIKALKPTEERLNGSVVWECVCECGTKRFYPANLLNANRIWSCGCINDSKGVLKIKQILNENNIKYSIEKTFSDCKFIDTNASARFDFYLEDENRLIEYDGEQHFKEKDLTYFKDTLEKRQEHDVYKNQWCKEHNIPLVRIPYTELNNLSIELLLGDKYLI